jgi:pyrroloquinoline quinone biosynthesis protein D
MPSMPPSLENSVPKLAAHARLHADPLTGATLLLYPEGVVELDVTAAEIMRRCDGLRTVDTISAGLAADFEGNRDEIARDVAECLRDLHQRGLIELHPPAS